MMEDKILNNDGLFAGPSGPTENEAAKEDSILETDSEDETTSTQKQRSLNAPKRHQDEQLSKPLPRKRKQENPRDHEEFLDHDLFPNFVVFNELPSSLFNQMSTGKIKCTSLTRAMTF